MVPFTPSNYLSSIIINNANKLNVPIISNRYLTVYFNSEFNAVPTVMINGIYTANAKSRTKLSFPVAFYFYDAIEIILDIKDVFCKIFFIHISKVFLSLIKFT